MPMPGHCHTIRQRTQPTPKAGPETPPAAGLTPFAKRTIGRKPEGGEVSGTVAKLSESRSELEIHLRPL